MQNVFHPRTPPRTLGTTRGEYPRRRSLYLLSPLPSGRESRDVARCSTLSARDPALAPPGLRLASARGGHFKSRMIISTDHAADSFV